MKKDEYSHEIWKRIRERVEMRYGARRAVIISIIVPVFLNAVAYFMFRRWWGIDAANQQILAFILGTVSVEIVLLSAFLYFLRFYDVPEEIYKEQKERLIDLDPDLVEIAIEKSNKSIPPKNRVGIDIINRTHEDFNGVIELIRLIFSTYDEHCNEHDNTMPIEIDNSHLSPSSPLTIKGDDHRVVDVAKLEDGRFIFLTENGIRFLIDMFFVRPETMPKVNFIKARFLFDFEVRGKFNDDLFTGRYAASIVLDVDRLVVPIPESSIEMEFVQYIPKNSI